MPGQALVAAPMAWVLVATAFLIAGWAGYSPFLTPADLTLPEAAATRDHLEILRQLRAGVDINEAGRVRAGLVRPSEYVMTPLEAAVASGQVDTVEFLQHHGARMDATTVAGLICLATLQENREMSAYLKEHAPPALALDCDHARLPWTY